MNSLLRSVTVLILPLAATAIVMPAASPPRMLELGGAIDRFMTGSIDVWVGCDTLDLVSPGRWVFHTRFVDYVTQQPAEGAGWKVVERAAESPNPTGAATGSEDLGSNCRTDGETS